MICSVESVYLMKRRHIFHYAQLNMYNYGKLNQDQHSLLNLAQ